MKYGTNYISDKENKNTKFLSSDEEQNERLIENIWNILHQLEPPEIYNFEDEIETTALCSH